jgi:hypothetical protein
MYVQILFIDAIVPLHLGPGNLELLAHRGLTCF